MISRWNRIAPIILCLVFAALSVWSFADGDYSAAGLQLAFSAFWLLATFRSRRTAAVGRRPGA